jgi:hypothetical protein
MGDFTVNVRQKPMDFNRWQLELVMNNRIFASEFSSGIRLGKFPPHRFVGLVAFRDPHDGFVGQRFHIANASVQALLRQGRELNFGHIQPTGFERSIVQLKPLRQGKRVLGRKRGIKRTWCVRVQIILDKTDPLCRRIIDSRQVVQKWA